MPPPRDSLTSIEHCKDTLEDLLEADPTEFGRKDLALLNLLCAPNLPGSERLDIPHCLERFDHLTAFVKASTERNLHRYPHDPDYGHSEPMWRMSMLVTVIKRSFGAAYDPDVMSDLKTYGGSYFTDSRNVFIHGLLDDDPKRRWGSCSSIPVLVTAIARRLGYPVGLAVTPKHVFARWEGNECFNIEASNPAGMTVETDDHYRRMHGPLTAKDEQSGLYVRTLYPWEEFAVFLKARVACLHDNARYAETFLWSARALQFCPDDRHFVMQAYAAAMEAVKHRYRQKYPDRFIPPPERNEEFFFLLGEFLAEYEFSLFLTIAGHHAEVMGEMDRARQAYEGACRYNFHGNNEQRDLQRFVRKRGRGRRQGPLLAPPKVTRLRAFELRCRPEQEADVLRQLGGHYERDGNLLKAHDAYRDLYLFDPSDADVFHHARELEKHPAFQEQLRAMIADRRRVEKAKNERPGENSTTHGRSH